MMETKPWSLIHWWKTAVNVGVDRRLKIISVSQRLNLKQKFLIATQFNEYDGNHGHSIIDGKQLLMFVLTEDLRLIG